jgi:hypothetical protein
MFFLTSCVDSTALMKNVSDLYKFIGEHQVNTKKYDFTSNAYTTTEKNEQFINFLQPQAVLNGYIFNSID